MRLAISQTIYRSGRPVTQLRSDLFARPWLYRAANACSHVVLQSFFVFNLIPSAIKSLVLSAFHNIALKHFLQSVV